MRRSRALQSDEPKKLRDRATIEALLRWSKQPASALKEWRRENPDTIIEIGGEVIGVEITKVIQQTPTQRLPPQMWELEAKRIVRKAQRVFHSRHPEPLNVRIGFRADWEPERESSALVNELATMIENELPALDGCAPHDASLARAIEHPVVSWLYVARTRFEALWEPSFIHTVQYASAGDIRDTVRRKEARLQDYRLAAPKVWLAIDCDLTGQGIALEMPAPDFLVTTGFDRVFCCGFGMYQWVELSTVRP